MTTRDRRLPTLTRRHTSAAQVLLEGVDARSVWRFLRAPQSVCVLLPDVVEAAVVSGHGVGERQRFVCRERGRDSVSVVEVTALEPGRSIELVLLNRPYAAGRSFVVEQVDGGTLLTLRSWAAAGWSWFGLGRALQADDDEYARRAAQVLPVLLQRPRAHAAPDDGGAGR